VQVVRKAAAALVHERAQETISNKSAAADERGHTQIRIMKIINCLLLICVYL